MKPIQVRAGGPNTGNTVFDQPNAAIVPGGTARAIIRADGEVHTVDGSLKVVKEAIERGDLISLEPIEEVVNDRALPKAG